MCGRLYLDTMHADHANLIMRYFSIRWFDLKTRNTVATIRISRSFLCNEMNEFMQVRQRQVDVCNARTIDASNAIMIFGVHGWSFKSFSLIKSWVQNRVSTMF